MVNSWIKIEVTGGIEKYPEVNENENTASQNMGGIGKESSKCRYIATVV